MIFAPALPSPAKQAAAASPAQLRLKQRMRRLITRAVRAGYLPFAYGAAPTFRGFKRKGGSNRPETFNEKLQFKLMHDRRPILKVYGDKLRAREYVLQHAPSLRVPRVLGRGSTVEQVMAAIPRERWVMKASHGASMVYLPNPGGEPDHAEMRRLARSWLQTDYSFLHWEWQYHNLSRQVYFEEFLGDGSGPPADYKFYVIHHKVQLITVDEGRFQNHTRNLFYPDWTPILTRKGHAPVSPTPPRKPENLAKMIQYAEVLSRDTDFLRVDLYDVDGELYFGELTHSPAAGDGDFEDRSLDRENGSHWKLPERYV